MTPDIAMCADPTCPSRRTCYRHGESGTVPGKWQSYGLFRRRPREKRCRDYWPLTVDGKKPTKEARA
jgi:hypothetical protein